MTLVLSPGIARADVWVGLGPVAWSRGGAREQPVLKNQTTDPNEDNDVDANVLNSNDK